MKIVTFSCDTTGCKFATQDKKAMITYIKYNIKSIGKKTKAVKVEEHFCGEDCLRKSKGYKEITVAK